MIGLLQRVSAAHVVVDGHTVGEIGAGLLVLLGIEQGDKEKHANRLLHRLLRYRVFPDETGKMNLNVRDVKGGLLLVPQFTLAADTQKGLRPSFRPAAPAEDARRLFAHLQTRAASQYNAVASGQFGADMQVHLVNDGPVTFWLRVSSKAARAAIPDAPGVS